MKTLKYFIAIMMLSASSAQALPPIIMIPLVGIGIYKTSQALNHISGGEDTLTLTEQSYQGCKQNDISSCVQKGIYTAVFFPADTVIAAVTGNAKMIGSSHGAIWHEVDKQLPVISKIQLSYGGAKYNQFIQKKR